MKRVLPYLLAVAFVVGLSVGVDRADAAPAPHQVVVSCISPAAPDLAPAPVADCAFAEALQRMETTNNYSYGTPSGEYLRVEPVRYMASIDPGDEPDPGHDIGGSGHSTKSNATDWRTSPTG